MAKLIVWLIVTFLTLAQARAGEPLGDRPVTLVGQNFCITETAATQLLLTWEQKGWDEGQKAFMQDPSCYSANYPIPVVLKQIALRKELVYKGFLTYVALVEVECAMCAHKRLFVIFTKMTTIKRSLL